MIKNKISLIIIWSFFVLLQISVSALAQQSIPQKDEFEYASLDTYEKVLDIVFPKETLNGEFGYGFVLRFKPSFDAESQISIENEAGKIQVVEYRLPDGHLYDQLSQLYKRGIKDEPEELAKHIRIQKRILKISPLEVKKWRESFYQNLGLASNYERKNITENMQQTNLADDGTSYLLWYHGASNIFYEFNGGSAENSPILSNESAIVNWMKGAKTNINKAM